jgi:hypothetical protein
MENKKTQAAAAPAFPDPVVSANIYCDGYLDEILLGAIQPVWSRLRASESWTSCYVWVIRYGKGGEHLKVRIHGPRDEQQRFRDLLIESTERCLSRLPARSSSRRRSRPEIPSIDVEDEVEHEYPDRTLLWTTYRRSFVSLGSEPFLSHDDYAAHMTEALGRGLGMALTNLGQAPPGREVPFRRRQTTLLKALIEGLPALGLGGTQQAAAYLAYHRDWLLRFFVGDEAKERELRLHFDRQSVAMGAAVKQLGELLTTERGGDVDGGDAVDDTESLWRNSLTGLALHLQGFRERPAYRTDPFAPDPRMPPVFKVFHGVANQLGLPPLEEALAHHLMLKAAAEVGAEHHSGSLRRAS